MEVHDPGLRGDSTKGDTKTYHQSTTSGEINSKTPTPTTEGGGGGRAPTTEGRGEPVGPIHTEGGGGAKGDVENAAGILLAMELGNIRAAEAQKAEDALNRLRPRIESLRERGYYVRVNVTADAPDVVDVLGGPTSTGDASQVVYFRSMGIEFARSRQELEVGKPTSMGPTEPGVVVPDKKRKYFHHVFGHAIFEPYPTHHRPAHTWQKPGFLGTYTPISFQLVSGEASHVRAFGLRRMLQIDGAPGQVTMWDLNDDKSYTSYDAWVDVATRQLRGRFTKAAEDSPDNSGGEYVIDSSFKRVGTSGDVLLEDARGDDKAPAYAGTGRWRARIYWMKS